MNERIQWLKAIDEYSKESYEVDGKKIGVIGHHSRTLLRRLREKDGGALGKRIEKTLLNFGQVLFWSDPHFGHANVIKYSERPFSTVEEMDAILMQGLSVNEKAMFLCLGDLALKNGVEMQRKLNEITNGRHFLIVGNHDAKSANPKAWEETDGVADSAIVRLPCQFLKELRPDLDWSDLPECLVFGMSHWPIPERLMPSASWVCVHGHIHEKKTLAHCMSFCVEQIEYKPTSFEQQLNDNLLENVRNRMRMENVKSHCPK